MNISRMLALFFFFGLAAVVVYWVSTLDPSTNRLIPFLIGTLPLLPFVRGMLHGRPKTHAFVALVSMPYLLHGSLELWSQSGNCLAIPEVIFAFGLLVSATFYARWSSIAASGNSE